MSSRGGRRRRVTIFDARCSQAMWAPTFREALRKAGVGRLQWLWHGWTWRLALTGAYPAIGRPLYAWTVALGPLEIRRLAG